MTFVGHYMMTSVLLGKYKLTSKQIYFRCWQQYKSSRELEAGLRQTGSKKDSIQISKR